MLLLFIIVLLIGYPFAAAWARTAAGGSVRRLWGVAASTLAGMAAATAILGQVNAVPSISRLVWFGLAFGGPMVIVPTLILSKGPRRQNELAPLVTKGLVGMVLGLLIGYALVVFVLRVW